MPSIMSKPKINFEKCDKAFIEKTFKIKQTLDFERLTNWLQMDAGVLEEELTQLNKAKKVAIRRINDWNEETLKMHFIATILNLVDFNSDTYSAFAGEKLEAEFDQLILTGIVDWFVATGIYKPEKPYFFFHEYKRRSKGNSDPEGQLLAEMIAARERNQWQYQALYGVVVVAQFWYFIVLKENEYAISKSFDSMDETELIQIFKTLKVAKREFIDTFLV
jgi:hypothetical protein